MMNASLTPLASASQSKNAQPASALVFATKNQTTGNKEDKKEYFTEIQMQNMSRKHFSP